MKTCKVCGKKIPKTSDYCSEECAEKDKATASAQTKNPPFLTQFDKIPQFSRGYGSVRRVANIQEVAKMLESGVPEDEIRVQLIMLFRRTTADDYIIAAKEWLKLVKAKRQ